MEERRRNIRYLLILTGIFFVAGTLLFVVGSAVYGGRDFQMSLLTSAISVLWAGAFGCTLLMVDHFVLSGRPPRSRKRGR